MGPLRGVRVLDLSRLLPGPLTTHILSRLGAEVIKVEQFAGGSEVSVAEGGDYVRFIEPMIQFDDGATHGALFEALNGHKRGAAINLKNPKGVEVLKTLVKELPVDVIVEGNRPGVMDRLGVGYGDLKEVNERICYCSISGYGQDGPMSTRAGHDINYMALSGLLSLSGKEGSVPPLPGFQCADGAGALQAVIGIQSALIERERTGKGQFVDISLCESVMALALPSLANGLVGDNLSPMRRGEGYLNGGLPNYKIYETKDGRYVSVGALESHFWKKFLDHLNVDEGDEIADGATCSEEGLRSLFASKTLSEWSTISEKIDVCIEPVLDCHSVAGHSQHKHRGVFLESSGHAGRQLVLGPRMSNYKTPEVFRRAAIFGEHTEEVLQEAGLSPQDVRNLMDSGAIFCANKTS